MTIVPLDDAELVVNLLREPVLVDVLAGGVDGDRVGANVLVGDPADKRTDGDTSVRLVVVYRLFLSFISGEAM